MSKIRQQEFTRVRYLFSRDPSIINGGQWVDMEIAETEIDVIATKIAHEQPKAFQFEAQRCLRKSVKIEGEYFEKSETLEKWSSYFLGQIHTVEEAEKHFSNCAGNWDLEHHIRGYCPGYPIILERPDGWWIGIPKDAQVFTIREIKTEFI